MSKYHVVKCDNDNPIWGIIFGIAVICILISAVMWFYHHVIQPAIHVLEVIVIDGSIAIGLFVVIVGGGFAMFMLATRRHVDNERPYLGNPATAIDSRRDGLARENTYPALDGKTATSYPFIPARPVNLQGLDAAMERLAIGPDMEPVELRSHADAWFLMHGIVPPKWD